MLKVCVIDGTRHNPEDKRTVAHPAIGANSPREPKPRRLTCVPQLTKKIARQQAPTLLESLSLGIRPVFRSPPRSLETTRSARAS